MATKFRIFRRLIVANTAKATKITKAACSLHNYLRICEMKNTPSSCFYRALARDVTKIANTENMVLRS